MIYRGLIHFHSKYSFDSVVSLKKITKLAIKNQLNFLVLTDHNTINGSLALKDYIEQKGLAIQVIPAAEYKTNLGDVIALNIKEEITDLNFDAFYQQVRKQGGALLLPHPYSAHTNVEYLAQHADLIEVFNARIPSELDSKAQQLAKKFNKKTYCAPDAHTAKSLNYCIIELESHTDLVSALLAPDTPIKCLNCRKSTYWEVIWSKFIRVLKLKKRKYLISFVKSLAKRLIKFQLFKPIT